MTKIISFAELEKNKPIFKGKKAVLVGGCFDLLHYGHLQFLKKAKTVGDFLIVALEPDEFIIKNKKRTPIHRQKERAEILASLEMVDLVILLPLFSKDEDYFNMVKIINPQIIAVTEGDPQLTNKKKQIEKVRGELKIVTPLLRKFSTRKIIAHFD